MVKCANQVKFVPSKSSTFVDRGVEFNLSFSTGAGIDPVVDDDCTWYLRNGSDTVSVGALTRTAANTTLFLITNQTAKFSNDSFSGVLDKPKAETRLHKKKSERLLGMSTNVTGFFWRTHSTRITFVR